MTPELSRAAGDVVLDRDRTRGALRSRASLDCVASQSWEDRTLDGSSGGPEMIERKREE